MANKIGNYIHYHKANYIKYGIGMKDKGKKTIKDFSNYKNEIKNMITTTVSDQQLINLSQNYTNFFYGNPIDMGKINSKQTKAQKLFLEHFNKRLLNKYSQIVQGFYKVDSLANLTTHNKHLSKNLSGNKNSVSSEVFKKIYKTIERLAIEGVTNQHRNYAKLKQNSDEIMQLVKEFQKIDKQWSGSRDIMRFDYSNNKGDLGLELKNLLNRAYEIIKLDNIPGNSNLIGVLGEESALMLAEVTGSMILDNVDNIHDIVYKNLVNGVKNQGLKAFHTGEKESYIAGNKKQYLKTLQDKNNSYLLRAKKSSQNKADFEIKLPKEKRIGISVKNYSFANRNDIGLVDKTSIIRLASNLNTEFINHWLNLKTYSKDDNGINYNALKQEADNTMKLGILALAASGRIAGKRNSAEIIAINNRTMKQWNFISIANLIKKQNALSLAKFTNYPESPVLQTWYGDKKKKNYPDAIGRIDTILGDLHQKKLTVSLNVTKAKGMKWIV